MSQIESLSRLRLLPQPILLLLLAGLYVLAGRLGLMLALVHPSSTAVWPPTGITLAAMLILGYRVWPGIFAGALLVNLFTAGTLATSLGVAAGNTLEGLVGAWLVNRFANGCHAFDRAMDAFRFALLAGLVSTTVSATLGVTSLALGGFVPWQEFGAVWTTWWLGDMGGGLVVAPVLILWSRAGRLRWSRRSVLEAGILLAVLLAVGKAVFGPPPAVGASDYSLKFVCMPVLVWIAFRFDQRTTATATLILSAIAVWGTIVNTASFAVWERNQSLQILQVFLAVTSASTLVLAATVAERARVEARVRAISEDLHAAMTELEAFSHALSHDLRSPIGAVVNYATLLEQEARGRLDAEGTRMLQAMRSSAESASRLLDQLMQFAWVERQNAMPVSVDMTSAARVAYAEVATGAEPMSNVRFQLDELPPARGNGALLERVFSNLLSNAVKCTRDREHRQIVVSGEAGVNENTYQVSDNGVGFDPALGDRLFQPFHRAGNVRDVEGTGLGLAIVARIIRKHGGRIWAESDGVEGARFTFTLPNGHADGNGNGNGNGDARAT